MHHPQARYPKELLFSSDEQKKEYFDNQFITKHSILKTTFDNVVDSLDDGSDKNIIVIAGPTGVGKTTLSHKLISYLYEEKHSTWKDTPEQIPAIYVEIAMHGSTSIDWKDLFRKILKALQEPLIDKKTMIKPGKYASISSEFTNRSLSESVLREKVEDTLLERKTKVIVLDEAQHLLKYFSGKSDKQFDVIKSIASRTGCTIAMVGTYEVIFYTQWSAQLSRVMHTFQFSNYKLDNNKNIQEFYDAFNGILAHIPLELDKKLLTPDVEYFFLGSCGCIGILKTWCGKALRKALKTSEQILTLNHFQETRHSNQKLERIALEIAEGENYFTEPGDDAIRKLLGLDKPKSKKIISETSEAKTKKNSKPGVRKPVRDPVT